MLERGPRGAELPADPADIKAVGYGPGDPVVIPERYVHLPVFEEKSGRGESWNPALMAPEPSSVYVVDRYLFVTDRAGRVVHVEGWLDLLPAEQNAERRNLEAQRPPGTVMTDQLQDIGRALTAGLPAGWREVTATYLATATYAELDATVTGPDGRAEQVDPLPEDLELLFEKLREEMYQPGKGAWLTATVTVAADGRFSTDFDYDTEPAWSIPVTPGTYAAELAQYPRDDQHIPPWMRDHIG